MHCRQLPHGFLSVWAGVPLKLWAKASNHNCFILSSWTSISYSVMDSHWFLLSYVERLKELHLATSCKDSSTVSHNVVVLLLNHENTSVPKTEKTKKHNLNSPGKADLVLPHLVFPEGDLGSVSCSAPFPETGPPALAKEKLTRHCVVTENVSVVKVACNPLL